MKRIHHAPAAAALFLSVAFLASCAKSESSIDESSPQSEASRTVIFNATVTPKGAQTRAVSESGETAWVAGEKIAVYYEKDGGEYGTATATVGVPDADGSASVTATLSGAKDGGTVKFVYPASLVNAAGDGIDIAKLQSGQHGTIADISANFDAATATATLATDGTACTTAAVISFENQALIGKFTPTSGGTAIDGITALTVTDGTATYTVTPSSGTFGPDGIYVALLPVDNKTVKISAVTDSQNYFYPGKSISLAAGKLYTNLSVAMTKGVDLSMLTANCTLHDAETITGTLDGNTQKIKVSIEDGATVTLSGAAVNGVHYGDGSSDTECLWAGLTCLGDATIVLADGTTNTVANFNRKYPCIQAAEGKTLVIKGGAAGTGKLIANAHNFGAGIGGGNCINCGNIEIQGGDITATGVLYSSGIGAGQHATCGSITITGGTVAATGGECGAGIGSAAGGTDSFVSSCGDISITGGTVTATGGMYAAGIGCGLFANCGNISISGGNIRAQGYATGIGCGNGFAYPSICGNISISYGPDFVSVVAIRGDDATYPIGVCTGDNIIGQITFGGEVINAINANSYDPSERMYGSLRFSKSTEKLGDSDMSVYYNNKWTLTL